MNYPVDFGFVQIGLILLILIAVALIVSALVMMRKRGPKVLLGRGIGGFAILVVAGGLLWVATLMQTYLGLSGEIKAAHVVVKEVGGQDHQLEVELTLFDDEGKTDRTEKYQVQGDLWVLQANIVELEPWVNALGFHSGYRVTRLYGQRLDGVATTQNHIFVNGDDRDFFDDMRDGSWYTEPFVRSAYGNAVIATPGEFDVYISRDAIKTRAAGS
ncbi:hypothetical protein [Nocardia bovistercoris]|uniref:Uncharacterized protein n=1 Tax=Nocardia bovistercoris TaxID=2785916 RepID=A0A931IGH4_9NOCA|nr:hypothetical protein [Nocardia bovistercoris]MBH0779971.1 hypothetical protein [Nocardia bovistercoris]